MLLGGDIVVPHGGGGYPEPALPVEGAQLHLGISQHLLGHVLGEAGLDIEPVLENVDGAEGAHPGLVAVHGGQIVSAAFFQKIIDLLHDKTSLFFSGPSGSRN